MKLRTFIFLFLIWLLALPLFGSRSFVAASSQYLTGGGLVGGYPVSVSFVAKPTSIPSGTFPVLFSIADVGGGNAAYCFVNPSISNAPIGVDGGGAAQVTSSVTLSTGTYQRITVVFTSSTSRAIYVGTTKDTNSNPAGSWGFTSATASSVGGYYTGLALRFWDGLIAEFAIWNVALTDADVASLTAGASAFLVRPSGLRFYTPLIGGSLNNTVGAESAWTNNGTTSSTDEPRIYR